MVETSKQVRVDNWGVFFLSRLQVFFNKTDYCDLTLQFEGNVQLKVHRLVMNACTDYFQILEETCDVADDVLMMPQELQADVILPIVNFMYTGMLEFQTSVFERLYKTAEMMNITVLLQLLDAQKQQPKLANKLLDVQKQQPKIANKIPQIGVQGVKRKMEKTLPATLPGRKLPVWKRKHVPPPPSPSSAVPSPATFAHEPRRKCLADPGGFDNAPKPTRFEWPEDDLKHFSLLDSSSFDNISYTSKPLLTQEEELRGASTSFDSVRYLPSSNKQRAQDYNSTNVDMDDLKSYVKEQKIRSDMVEFEDEEVDNNVDDPDYVDASQRRKVASKKVRFSLNEKENKETKYNVTSSTSAKPSDVDHSKIISEVLKKYPHLVKKNKNIRLKILAKNKDNAKTTPTTNKVKLQMKQQQQQAAKEPNDGPWSCHKCFLAGEEVEFVLYYLYRKHMTDVHNEKFDSRMCKYCGHKSNKHNMMMYHQYTKHGIKPPPAYNFPRCNQCPYVALTENLMIKHKLNHTKFDLQCEECKVGFNSELSLKQHVQITGHSGKSGRNNYDCQYCTKHYQTGANLFSHIRLQHREEARRDGIVSIDEDDAPEEAEAEEEEDPPKIKILSDVSIDESAKPQQQELPSLGLVDIVVLDDNQQYIQQLDVPQDFNFMPAAADHHNVILGNSDIASTDELVMVLTDHDYNDGNGEILAPDNSSNIVVLYSHPVEGQQGQFITSQGNIMLNSETGMLELRDGADAAAMDAGAVESIEMIQREIESHANPDVKAVVPLVAPQETVVNIPDSTATYHPEEGEIVHHQDEQEYIVEEEILKPEEEEGVGVVAVKDEQQQELQQDDIIGQTQPNEAEAMEVDEEITSSEIPDDIHPPVIENTQTEESLIEILQEKIDSTPMMQEEEIKQPEPQGEPQVDLEQPVEEEMLMHESMEILQPTMGTENVEAEEEPPAPPPPPPTEEIPVDLIEPTMVNEGNETPAVVEEEKSETVEEIIPYIPDAKPEVGEEEEGEKAVPVVAEEEAKEIPKDDSTSDSVLGSTNPSEATSTDETEEVTAKPDNVDALKTAKSLLDDWEDTDSQQSEHGKSVNTVNKLINDWDDD